MASVIQDPSGFKRVQWSLGGGERRTLRLGKVSLRQAEAVKVRIEQLLAARSTGVLDAEAAKWLQTIDSTMRARLAKAGLAAARDKQLSSLGALLEEFFSSVTVKASTKRTYQQTRDGLEEHFGKDRALSAITPLDADQWKQAMLKQELAPATIARRIKTARQVFKQAMRWKVLDANPFAEVKAGGQTNRARMFFVTQQMVQKVLDACPDDEWRLIVVLSRYGGLRVPSEILPLTWADIDFDKGLIHVASCKTEGYAGKDRRVVPMFPQLRAALLAVYEQAPEGSEHVIFRHRLLCRNLRTQLVRIIRRSGQVEWPKAFHNMRSSRQTELSARHPIHLVCAWLGNSPTVALEHYLQVRDSDHAQGIDLEAAALAVTAVAGSGAEGAGAARAMAGGGVAGSVGTGRGTGQGGASVAA